MGFNLYFAGADKGADEHIIKIGGNRLFSQANERSSIKRFSESDINHNSKLFIDSGAFSVAHAGKEVDLDEYISFINSFDDKVDVWVQLDSIPFPELNAITAKECSEKSWQNYLYMVDKVPTPKKLLPLYHFGEPKENLKRILNTPIEVLDNKPAPYIGVGGRHGVSTEQQLHYFDDVFKIVKSSNNPNVKIHAFGMTVLTLLEQFPFYSADSTTWLKLAVFGTIVTPYGNVYVSDRGTKEPEHLLNLPKDAQKKVVEYIESKGYNYDEISTSRNHRLMLNVDYFKDWADNYQYKPLGIKRKRLI